MDRCKLEYMIKNFDIKEKKKMIQLMDPYGDYMFKKSVSKYLENPDTTDPDILIYVAPLASYYYTEILYNDIESAKMHKMEAEKEIADVKQQFINQFKLINDLCIKNNTYPFFKDPTNLVECEKTRLDIVKIIPEETLNKHFGVESIRWYEPPKYNNDK